MPLQWYCTICCLRNCRHRLFHFHFLSLLIQDWNYEAKTLRASENLTNNHLILRNSAFIWARQQANELNQLLTACYWGASFENELHQATLIRNNITRWIEFGESWQEENGKRVYAAFFRLDSTVMQAQCCRKVLIIERDIGKVLLWSHSVLSCNGIELWVKALLLPPSAFNKKRAKDLASWGR